MKDLNLENGQETVLGDTIPYTFLDVNSHADLIYLASEKCYYAVTVHQVEGNNYEANIYLLHLLCAYSKYVSTGKQGDLVEITIYMYLCSRFRGNWVEIAE